MTDHADCSASFLVYLEYLDRNNYTLFNLATLRITVVRAGIVKCEGWLPTASLTTTTSATATES